MTGRLWPWLRVLIGVGILAALGWKLGGQAFLDGLRVIDARALFAALAIGLFTTVCSAWRWCLVARRLGLRLPLPTAVADYYRALLLNAVLPAGVLGDAHRAVSHGRSAGDLGRGVRAVVLERVAGQVVLITVGAVVLVGQPAVLGALAGQLVPDRGPVLAVVVGLVVMTLAVLVLVRGRSRWPPGLLAALSDLRVGLMVPAVVPLSVAALLGHVGLFLVAARAAGTSAPATQLAPLLLLALLAMSLPLNVGGWGPREAACALAFGAAGLSAAQGLTTAVVYGVLAMVASLPGVGVLVLRRGSVRSGQNRQMPAERLDEAGEQFPPLLRGSE